MPRLVDHTERRRTILRAACRLIAARGIDGTNMRDLAREAGYTNGALSHYFAGKDEILRAAFEHVFDATNERIIRSVGRRRGLAALRRMCHEVAPRTEETLVEARIAVSLWQRALNDADLAAVNARQLETWRTQLLGCLREAHEDGEIVDVDETGTVNLLITTMVGLQVTGVLDPDSATPALQEAMIDRIIAQVATPRKAKARAGGR